MADENREPERAWLIRAGRAGERDDFALTNGLAGGGFREVGDLSGFTTREEIQERVRAAFPAGPEGKITNFTAQLLSLRSRIQIGDLIALPLKTTRQVAIGRVSGPYRYDDDADPNYRHLLPVTWKVTDLSRTAIHKDLLHSLGAAMTVCELRRNDAAYRLGYLMEHGSDPGARPGHSAGTSSAADAASDETSVESDDLDLEQAARDRILDFIGERFAAHALEGLVKGVLEAEGFVCQGVDPGPDGGIDIYAGRGMFGFDPPRLVVQVKSSASKVEAQVVQQLNGALTATGADQGLLVAWAGVTKAAKQMLRSQFFRLRVWTADDLLEALMRNYDRLDEDLRADLPMKRIWTLVDDTE